MPINQSARMEFLQKDGFILYTDANLDLLDELNRIPPARIPEGEVYLVPSQKQSFPAQSLHAVTRGLVDTVMNINDRRAITRRSGITMAEMDQANRYTFNYGFDDPHFTWHFAAGIASAVTYQFVKENVVTPQQYANLSLTDWATMISSGWFSKLIHSMAFTKNGFWKRFGMEPNNYDPDGLRGHFNLYAQTRYSSFFDVDEKMEPTDGKLYPIASLRTGPRTVLRKEMREAPGSGSIGCPVARKATRVSKIDIEGDPQVEANPRRIQRLAELGIFSIEKDAAGNTSLHQSMTAIDRTLIFFAQQLAWYDRQYGTPQLHITEDEKIMLRHARIPQSEAFRRDPFRQVQLPSNWLGEMV